jgi:hypothetical protein
MISGSLQHGWFFLSLLKAACHYHRQQTHMEFSRYSPKVKVTSHYQGLRSLITFLRDKYKSVMSTSRQTDGAHGYLMSPQKVRYHLKVEQSFARSPRRGLMLTYKHQTLHLAWARIHLRFTRAWGPLVVGRGCSLKTVTVETLSKEMLHPPPFSQHWRSGKQYATGMTFRDTFVYETALCGCY